MRGSRRVIRAEYFDEGIIPAHAGLTDTAGRLCRPKWDRPRACGAHIEYDVPKNMVSGSSPRMRGSHLRDCGIGRRLGIIPAHAGLTTLLAGICGPSGDHPRACGAHLKIPPPLWEGLGSSPRMRGSPSDPIRYVNQPGIIPAHAGSRAVPAGRHEPGGIIPAHAGLTKVSSHSNILSGDHPRACGAHLELAADSFAKQGSSPRMRGSHIVRYRIRTRVGIIPAHAGLTRGMSSRLAVCGDHPRACGAHTTISRGRSRPSGSSPRMRGSLTGSIDLCSQSGIIPAHAGLTFLRRM